MPSHSATKTAWHLSTIYHLNLVLNVTKMSNFTLQCPPLNRITLGQHKNDNNNRMIQLTDKFCELLRYYGTSNIWLQYAADSIIRDPIKRRTSCTVYIVLIVGFAENLPFIVFIFIEVQIVSILCHNRSWPPRV